MPRGRGLFWWWSSTLPTTAAGVDRGIALLAAGLRLGTLAQMIPSVHAGVVESPRPGLYLAAWLFGALAIVGTSIAALIRGRVVGPVGAAIDVAVGCALLLIGSVAVDPDNRLGTWIGYAPAYALTMLICVSGTGSLVQWLISVAAVILCYILYLDTALDGSTVFAALGNILTYVFASVGRVTSNYIRKIARTADESRAQVAELARREEERRAQLAMHNGVVIMRMLADPELSGPSREQLLDQSIAEINRIRSYMRNAPHSPSSENAESIALPDVVRRVANRYADLPIESVLDLGDGVELSADDAAALEHALDSLLLNVREHAGADQVVVHLDVEDDGRWSLTVSDNGAGFDPASSDGVGLREVVIGQLTRLGMEVEIDSTVGDGTTVTIEGLDVGVREESA